MEYFARLNGTTETVMIQKEVILAAGAIHSPQILQLSGIGDDTLLNSFGIKTRVDLPGVGKNFQDHPTLYPVFNCEESTQQGSHTLQSPPVLQFTSKVDANLEYFLLVQAQLIPNLDELTSNHTYAAEQLALYFSKRQGPYTIVNEGGNTVAFLPLPNITSSYQSIIDLAKSQQNSVYGPGLHSTILDGYCAQREIVLRLYGSTDASVQETGWGGGDVMPITLVKPLSRGSVTINCTDILQQPLIDWKAFTFPSDIEIMVAALRINRKLIASEAMQELQPVEVVPGANLTSDDELRTALRQQVVPTYSHPCCTCAMMKRELGGVVDAKLRVHGVENLRVVDASIMPLIPATHTSATVYAVAEKAADLIKERWEHDG